MADGPIIPAAEENHPMNTWADFIARHPEWAPLGRESVCCLPQVLIAALERPGPKYRMKLGLNYDWISPDDFQAERDFTTLFEKQDIAGVIKEKPWKYWPASLTILEDQAQRTLHERTCAYIGYLLCNAEFFQAWEALKGAHPPIIQTLEYPLQRLPLAKIEALAANPELQAFHRDFRVFTRGWCIQGMARDGLPMPAMPEEPATGLTEAMTANEDLGMFVFVPWHLRLDRTEPFSERLIIAAQGLQKERMRQEDWLCKCRPHGNGIQHMARCFIYSFYGSEIIKRYPQVTKIGARKRLDLALCEYMDIGERALKMIRRDLKVTRDVRHHVGLLYP